MTSIIPMSSARPAPHRDSRLSDDQCPDPIADESGLLCTGPVHLNGGPFQCRTRRLSRGCADEQTHFNSGTASPLPDIASQNVDSHSRNPRISRLSTIYRFLNPPRSGLQKVDFLRPAVPRIRKNSPLLSPVIANSLRIFEKRLRNIENSQSIEKTSAHFQSLAPKNIEKTIFPTCLPIRPLSQPANLSTWNLQNQFRPPAHRRFALDFPS
jgi:hypothetical protein